MSLWNVFLGQNKCRAVYVMRFAQDLSLFEHAMAFGNSQRSPMTLIHQLIKNCEEAHCIEGNSACWLLKKWCWAKKNVKETNFRGHCLSMLERKCCTTLYSGVCSVSWTRDVLIIEDQRLQIKCFFPPDSIVLQIWTHHDTLDTNTLRVLSKFVLFVPLCLVGFARTREDQRLWDLSHFEKMSNF